MRILITGGDGEFCKHLVEQGKEHSYLTPSKEEADIRHYWKLDRYFYQHQNDFDYVIHAAGLSSPMYRHDINPRDSIEKNIIVFEIEVKNIAITKGPAVLRNAFINSVMEFPQVKYLKPTTSKIKFLDAVTSRPAVIPMPLKHNIINRIG